MDRHDYSTKTTDDVGLELSCSHGSDNPEDADFHLTANDGVTDYENDELSNSGENIMSVSPSDNHLAESSARLLAVSDRQGALLDCDISPSVLGGQNLLDNSTNRGTTEFALMDNITRWSLVDGSRNHEDLSLHMPSEGVISPSQDFDDERDPNYATQRPDTLGATINIAAAAAANAFAGPIAQPSYQATAAARAWTMQSAADDNSLAHDRTAHLGRRTRGAGMDELELNQRQLMNDDENAVGDGSELCDDDDDEEDDDTGLGSVNQCESTEADQYKMDPEADQTAGLVGSEVVQQNGTADDVRLGARGCTVGHRRRTDGALSHVMDDPEEDQASTAVRVDDAALVSSALVSVPIDAPNSMPVVSDEQQRGALKRHPQSAFSVPKPRVTKRKPVESDLASYSERPVPSVRHSKSNTDIVFKPISTGHGILDSVALRTLLTSKSANGSHVTGIMHGELSQHSTEKKQLSTQDSGIMSHDKKHADGGVESDRCHPSRQAHDASLWTRESLWNDVHTCSSVSLPSACHLPGEGGAIAVGTFAPANSSSQQATPVKTDTRACCMHDNSVDVSPIQPVSSSSSRPLSVNGSNVLDSASVNYVFPSTEFNIGIHPQYSHKVCFHLQFLCHLCFFLGIV